MVDPWCDASYLYHHRSGENHLVGSSPGWIQCPLGSSFGTDGITGFKQGEVGGGLRGQLGFSDCLMNSLCQWEVEECIFQVQGSAHLFLWKNQTLENQGSHVASSSGKAYSRVTGRVLGCLCLSSSQAIWTASSPCFQSHCLDKGSLTG